MLFSTLYEFANAHPELGCKRTISVYLKACGFVKPFDEDTIIPVLIEYKKKQLELQKHLGNTFTKGKKIKDTSRMKKAAKKRCEAFGAPLGAWKEGHTPWNKGKTGIYSEETLDKMRNKDNYGRKRYKFGYNYFDSSWELIYYMAHNAIDEEEHIFHEYVRRNTSNSFSYEYNGKKHKYIPDFKTQHGLYIELKGPQFFKDGKMINPFNREEDELYEAKHQCMIDNRVIIINSIEKEKKQLEQIYGEKFWVKYEVS